MIDANETQKGSPASLGAALDELAATIESRRTDATGDRSYTAQLLTKGAGHCAKKLGEEAVEAAIAGALGDKPGLAQEAADVIYHLLVLLAAAGVAPGDVADVLARRQGVSGLDEKASRPKG